MDKWNSDKIPVPMIPNTSCHLFDTQILIFLGQLKDYMHGLHGGVLCLLKSAEHVAAGAKKLCGAFQTLT